MRVMLDSFRSTAKDLLHPGLSGWNIWLRLEGDSDDPNTWHQVNNIGDHMFQGVNVLAVSFHDETPDVVLNDDDPVEFAVLRPPGLPPPPIAPRV
jgi:hypothetical protein